MKTYNDLLARVQNALSNEPLLKSALSNIYILVNDGAVILSGSVENIQLKKLTMKIVSDIPGINMLFEDLRIEPIHDRVDVQIDWTTGKMALSH